MPRSGTTGRRAAVTVGARRSPRSAPTRVAPSRASRPRRTAATRVRRVSHLAIGAVMKASGCMNMHACVVPAMRGHAAGSLRARGRRFHPAVTPTPGWSASQAWSGGSAGPEPLDASGAGAILFSQQIGHSTCGRPCRPCSCSHAKYAAPATSTTSRPPPKGSPGTLGIRRSMAVHLPSIRRRDRAIALQPGPLQCDTTLMAVLPRGRGRAVVRRNRYSRPAAPCRVGG
jgi:hypothetical protein